MKILHCSEKNTKWKFLKVTYKTGSYLKKTLFHNDVTMENHAEGY
jgi:hypothetical protein